MAKVIVAILNPGESPADNGRTIHALKLAKRLKEAGSDVKVVFEGQAVGWIGRFVNRDDSSHPFVKHYGHVFDDVRDVVHACNMCCKRFDATQTVRAAEIPILGEGQEHIDIGGYVLDGHQVINH